MLSDLLGERGNWTPLQPLDNYNVAPASPGLYEIGFQIQGYSTPFCLDIGYPRNFRPMYVGITMRSLRERLSEHSRGGTKANRFIRLYNEEIKRLNVNSEIDKSQYPAVFAGLYYSCITYALPAILECSRIQRGSGTAYPWNTRSEIQTLITWGNMRGKDLDKPDVKERLLKLRHSRALDDVIAWAEIG